MLFIGFFVKINNKRMKKGMIVMESSKLVSIISRLEAMTKDQTDNLQVRRFEVDGVERAQVTYDHEKKIFTVIDHSIEEELTFDNIDFVAMEVFELIQPRTEK